MNESAPQSRVEPGPVPPRICGVRPDGNSRRANRRAWLAGGALAAVALGVLFVFDPAQHGFYPQCFFHHLTAWDCHGCGGLRALHHLLRGDVAAAFHFNPLVVLGAPLAALLAGWLLWARRRGKTPGTRALQWLLWMLPAALLVYAVARNVLRS